MQEPVANVEARPDPSNILEWHFVIQGAPGTPYEGGVYHGKLLFPPDYPYKPPGIFFVTPSGRFKPYVKICFSFTDYHPGKRRPQPCHRSHQAESATQRFITSVRCRSMESYMARWHNSQCHCVFHERRRHYNRCALVRLES